MKYLCDFFPDNVDVRQFIAETTYVFLPICKIIFNGFCFKDSSLQAVLFLVPKNVSESHITNDICQVECTQTSFYSVQISQHQAQIDAVG